jgi:hypothetical protein
LPGAGPLPYLPVNFQALRQAGQLRPGGMIIESGFS